MLGVLVFIVSRFALTVYSICNINKKRSDLLSKKKILKAILMALTVLLTAAQSTDGKEEPAE